MFWCKSKHTQSASVANDRASAIDNVNTIQEAVPGDVVDAGAAKDAASVMEKYQPSLSVENEGHVDNILMNEAPPLHLSSSAVDQEAQSDLEKDLWHEQKWIENAIIQRIQVPVYHSLHIHVQIVFHQLLFGFVLITMITFIKNFTPLASF